MALADPDVPLPEEGLLVLLPIAPGGPSCWWRIDDGALGESGDGASGWGDLAEDARVVALVPAVQAPVRIKPRGALPMAQALTATRLEASTGQGWDAAEMHVAVAPGADADSVLLATASTSDMDRWLATLAAAGVVPDALVPAALVLPDPPSFAEIGVQPVARTTEAAFAGERELVAELVRGEVATIAGAALDAALLAAWRSPELNLRQGPYAPRRVSFFRLPDWVQLARMAAVAALLGFLILAVETVKLNWDASTRESAALVAAQKRFPAAVDLASAQSLSAAELARRGVGGGSFAAPAAAVLAAMRPIPSLILRDLGYGADGTLRVQAAAPTADSVNQFLAALQREGWQVTVPPSLAPDPTGATVAAITVRAP